MELLRDITPTSLPVPIDRLLSLSAGRNTSLPLSPETFSCESAIDTLSRSERKLTIEPRLPLITEPPFSSGSTDSFERRNAYGKWFFFESAPSGVWFGDDCCWLTRAISSQLDDLMVPLVVGVVGVLAVDEDPTLEPTMPPLVISLRLSERDMLLKELLLLLLLLLVVLQKLLLLVVVRFMVQHAGRAHPVEEVPERARRTLRVELHQRFVPIAGRSRRRSVRRAVLTLIVLMQGSDEEEIDATVWWSVPDVEVVGGTLFGTTGGATVTSATLPGTTANLWASLPRRRRSNFLPILRPHVNTAKESFMQLSGYAKDAPSEPH
uniref:Uncharacterized protein n=1 Tax=Anopheles farauti TaxID=69004 RepID=A0A182QQ65_9DIPT